MIVSATMTLTSISMTAEVKFIDDQVVVSVKLPELAVNDVKVLVGEKVCDSVNIFLVVQDA